MRVKLEERNKIKKANGNAQRVIEIKHQMSATGEAEAKARTKAQKSCHMQRSSAKMAATCLTSCKRAKGIREAAKEGRGGEQCVCVEVFGKNEVDASAAPRQATLCRRQLPRQMKSSRSTVSSRAGTTKYEQEDEDEAEAEHDGRGLCAQIQFTCVRVTGQGNQQRARLKAARQGSVTCP